MAFVRPAARRPTYAYENGKSDTNETEIGITQKYKKEARNTWGSSSGQCLIVDVKNWFT